MCLNIYCVITSVCTGITACTSWWSRAVRGTDSRCCCLVVRRYVLYKNTDESSPALCRTVTLCTRRYYIGQCTALVRRVFAIIATCHVGTERRALIIAASSLLCWWVVHNVTWRIMLRGGISRTLSMHPFRHFISLSSYTLALSSLLLYDLLHRAFRRRNCGS